VASEAKKEYMRRWYLEHREQQLERVKEYRKGREEQIRATKKAHYERNKEKVKAAVQRYREENAEKVREFGKEYRLHNKDKITAYWHKTPVEVRMLRAAKTRAKREGLPFDLELSDIVVPDVCPFLGIAICKHNKGSHQPNSPSLDKIDPTKGYVKGNVHVISYKANAMKRDASVQELLMFALGCTNMFGLVSGYGRTKNSNLSDRQGVVSNYAV